MSHTEDLLKETAGDASEQATKARARAEASLRDARKSLSEMEQHLAARARQAAKATNRYVTRIRGRRLAWSQAPRLFSGC